MAEDLKGLHEKAELLAQKIPFDRLHPEAATYLKDSTTNKLFIACSGGADSVALLLLADYFSSEGIEIHALHYNHALRAEDSDADEEFVRSLCHELSCEFHSEKKAGHEGSGINEAMLREWRLEFFNKTMDAVGGDVLLTGHHIDDVAETMIIRLSRGSGTRGMSAPRPVQKVEGGRIRVRPLLALSKAEIMAALKSADISWREDESNHEDAFYRNALRNKLIPLWEEFAPQELKKNIASSRSLFEEDDEALESIVDSLNLNFQGQTLNLEFLKDQPAAVIRRALYRFLIMNKKSEILGRNAMDELVLSVKAQRKSGKWSLGGDFFLVLKDHELSINAVSESPEWSPLVFSAEASVYLPNGFHIFAEWVDLGDELIAQIRSGGFENSKVVHLSDLEIDMEYLRLRLWTPGDRYRPLGCDGSKKLQDMFTDAKISGKVRRELPIITTMENEILWCPGFPPAESVKIGKNAKKALRLTYQKV